MGPTQVLADFVVNTDAQHLPMEVLKETKRSLLNALGAALGASDHPSVNIVLELQQMVGGKGQATILGRRERTDVAYASLINGMMMHILDFDDTHLDTIIHPMAPVVPVALSVGEWMGKSGLDVLAAIALACEVECRIGLSVFPEHYDIGWHITSTVGTFGAAAVAGKLLDLDVSQMTQAFGLAATQSSGLREMFGTMTKPFHPGKAAMDGLLGALLAQRGFTSSSQALEAKRGFCSVLSPKEADWDVLTNGLGKSYEILKNSYKPFACGIVIHPVIDGVIQLRDAHGLVPDDIEKIEAHVNRFVLELTGKTKPKTGLEGKFSVYHCAAVAVIDGKAGPEQFTDDRVCDSTVVALRNRVNCIVDPAIREDEARIKITKRDGSVIECHVEHALGSLQRPLSDHELQAKFLDLATKSVPKDQAERAISAVMSLDQASSVSSLIQLCVPPEVTEGRHSA